MSNVQFNLLPASKHLAMKSEERGAQLVRKSYLAAIICAALFILLIVYTDVIQRQQITTTNKEISTQTSKVEGIKNLTTILTVQNQLKTAATLHQNQHDTSRILNYLTELTPLNASVNNLSLDMNADTIKIEGSADNANTVNSFVDALKYAQYQVGSSAAKTAFSSVVESNFAIGQTGITYSINASFDPQLFANSFTDANGSLLAPQLKVPNSSSTHNDPGSLFGGGQ